MTAAPPPMQPHDQHPQAPQVPQQAQQSHHPGASPAPQAPQQPVGGPQPIEIRPDFTHYRRQLFAAPLLLTAIGAYVIWQSNRSPYGWTVAGVTLVLCLIGIAVFFKRARIVIGPEGATKVGLVGSKRVGWDRLGRVLLAPEIRNIDPRLNAALFLLDRDDKLVFPMTAPAWSPAAMDQVSRATGAPVVMVPPGETFKNIRTHYPKAVPFYLARPLLLGAIIGVALIVVIVGVVIALVNAGVL